MLIEGIRGPSTIAVLVVTILSVTSSTILDSEPTDSQTPEGAINEVVGSGNIDPFVGWQVGGMSETHPEPIAERSATENERTDTKSEAGYADDMPVQAPVCLWTTIDQPASSTLWGGQSAANGHLETLNCGATTDDGSGMGSARLDTRFVPNATPAAPALPPPPPDPAILAQQAYRELHVPRPTIGAGPDRDKLAVNLWTWLWVDNPGQLTTTVAAAGVSVTATATLASVTWSLGEPPDTGNGYAPGAPVSITCQGTGTAPAADYDWKAQPPCGYMFNWRSLKERTGGTGKWPITATSNWNVTWQSNTGVTGNTTLAGTSNDAFDIGEYRIVLVQQPGG